MSAMPLEVSLTGPSLGEFARLWPELVLAGMGLVVLVLDLVARRSIAGWGRMRRAWLGRLATGSTLLIAAGLGLDVMLSGERTADLLSGVVTDDPLTRIARLVLALGGAGTLALATRWPGGRAWPEQVALLLWSIAGTMVLAAATDLLVLFVALELQTMALYLATGLAADGRRSSEAAFKFFLYAGASGAILAFGLSWLFGASGSTRLEAITDALSTGTMSSMLGPAAIGLGLVLILVGFGFKLAAAPFHPWAPDAYEGGPTAVALWLATGSKLAALLALVRLLMHLRPAWLGPAADGTTLPLDGLGIGMPELIAGLAGFSMVLGNLVALRQTRLKRLLAYAGIGQVGYVLIAVAIAARADDPSPALIAILYFMLAYLPATWVLFALAGWLEGVRGSDHLAGLADVGRSRPVMVASVTIAAVSLVGLPPTGGFLGKLLVFIEPFEQDRWAGLAALGLAMSVVSAGYYVRILRAFFLPTPPGGGTSDLPDRQMESPSPLGSWLMTGLILAVVVLLMSGVVPGPIADRLGELAAYLPETESAMTSTTPPSE